MTLEEGERVAPDQKDVEEVATRTASHMTRWFEEQGAGEYDSLADEEPFSLDATARLLPGSKGCVSWPLGKSGVCRKSAR